MNQLYMALNANDLLEWKDFPKGLTVLLLEEDSTYAAEIRSKLEEMDYIVSTFYNVNEALSAISNSTEGFHVALVEVSTDTSDGRFKFLQIAKDLPTIMTSDMHCLSTIMKCIALGAVEFLRKPLSEEKIRNIWQHVVHKAFNEGGKDLSESLKPVQKSVTQLANGESDNQLSVQTEHTAQIQENNQGLSSVNDKYPAPSTPQIERKARLLNEANCQDQTNSLTEKERMEQNGHSKSVKTTIHNSLAKTTVQMSPPQGLKEVVIKEKDKNNVCPQLPNSCGCKANRKRMKVDWTSELHEKFLQAVEKLGVEQAIPSKILKVMDVEGLTRHNIASHLQQKYRMQQRHILQRSYYPCKAVMAFPPYHSTNCALPANQFNPAWVPPSSYPSGPQLWGPPHYPPSKPPGVHGDPRDHLMMHPLVRPYCPQNASPFQSCRMPQNSVDLHPAEELIDQVVKEVISKPWLPLPLGLKPPSTQSVLTELSKQGIFAVPPAHTQAMHPH